MSRNIFHVQFFVRKKNKWRTYGIAPTLEQAISMVELFLSRYLGKAVQIVCKSKVVRKYDACAPHNWLKEGF